MKYLILALIAVLAFSSTQVAAQDCATCELVINFVEQWVESNATEAQILSYLDTLCGLFPSYQSTCDALAQQGLAQIITWVNANETPEEICTQLGECTSSKKIGTIVGSNMPSLAHIKLLKPNTKVPFKVLTSTKTKQQNQVGDAVCDGCTEVIGVIENWLDQSNNQQEVITAIEVVCTYMPEWETTCDAIIAAGVPEVVQWIETYENSTMVCEQLGLCGTMLPKKVIPRQVGDDCSDCQQVISAIEYYVATNTSESAIVSYAELICNIVPQFTDMCDSFIVAEVPQIISWIEANETPQQICTSLGVCTSIKKPFHIIA